ncbi:MAG: molybdate ABC transporter substrate-binding protein, partial [Fusobacterium periodonticum]|nr:molybdate ABC transporter substrate-binding protein [Fusobacterium periodonticum]
MKKFLRVFLVLTMILGFTACSSKQAENKENKETKVEKTE